MTFTPREIHPRSEQVSLDNPLAWAAAEPLFAADVRIGAITEKIDYRAGVEHSGHYRAIYHRIMVMLQGGMNIQIADKEDELGAGDMAYWPPGTQVGYNVPDKGWWLYFEMTGTPHWDPLKKTPRITRQYEFATQMFILLRAVLDAHASHSPPALAYARTASRTLLALINRQKNAKAPVLWTRRKELEHLVRDIGDFPAENWSREEMASQMDLSVRQFSRLFASEYGVSPVEMVIKKRLNLAIDKLLKTDDKIEIIAQEVGYKSVYSFSRLFRKHVGISPGQLRLQSREKND